MTYRSIVLGVDGSEQSMMAAYWSAAVATRTGASVTAVHGLAHWIDRHYADLWPDPDRLQSEVERQMREEWCRPLVDAGVELRYRVVADDPATALLAAARDGDADIVVLGRHGRSAWAPHLLGSVTYKVLHDPPCPIVVVPGPTAQADRANVDRRVVVGVAGSQRSVAALEWAVRHAGEFDLHVEVVSAAFTQFYREAAWLAEIDDAAAVAALERLVRPMVARATQTGTVGVSHEVVVGRADSILVERSTSSELLVVGTRGRGAVEAFLVGSVSHYCAARALCPVVLVPDL